MMPGYSIKPLHRSVKRVLKTDITESTNAYIIKSHIPGMHKDNIHVLIDNGSVSIQAESDGLDQKPDDVKELQTERNQCAVSRSFRFPLWIDHAKATGAYENGVLILTLPKKIGDAPKKLKIH